jgi:hypothetical protein
MEPSLAIYAHMIYTAPYIMFLMCADPLRAKAGGVGPGNRYFFGPREMLGPKKLRFPGPSPLLLAQVIDLPVSKTLCTGPYKS